MSDTSEAAPPLTADESVYARDENGDLLPIEKVVETTHGPRQVAYEPTPIGEANRLREEWGDRDDLDMEELDELMNRKVVEPDIDWSDDDIRPGVYNPVLDGLLETMIGEAASNEFHAEVREELEARADEGN